MDASTPPGSNIVPHFVFRIVPHRGKSGHLCVHEVTPLRVIAPFAKEANEVEHFAGERIGQQLHLLVKTISAMVIRFSSRSPLLGISYHIRPAQARPPPDGLIIHPLVQPIRKNILLFRNRK